MIKLPAATAAPERPPAKHREKETHQSFAARAADIGGATLRASQATFIDLWFFGQNRPASLGEYHVSENYTRTGVLSQSGL
jgi:hypothetical protein